MSEILRTEKSKPKPAISGRLLLRKARWFPTAYRLRPTLILHAIQGLILGLNLSFQPPLSLLLAKLVSALSLPPAKHSQLHAFPPTWNALPIPVPIMLSAGY